MSTEVQFLDDFANYIDWLIIKRDWLDTLAAWVVNEP